MKKNKLNAHTILPANNLLHKKELLAFLSFQSAYGIAIRGGSLPPNAASHLKRLSHKINLLNKEEIRQLVVSETFLTH